MLTALPTGYAPEDSDPEVSQRGAGSPGERPLEHLCQVCPNCGARLESHRCKLLCNQCGYFMSCADYY